MSVKITLVGSGTIGPVLQGWNVQEDATPVSPGDTAAGTGGVNFTARAGEDSEFIIDNLLTFTHDTLGTVTGGKIATLTTTGANEDTDTTVQATGSTLLGLLNVSKYVPPTYSGVPVTKMTMLGGNGVQIVGSAIDPLTDNLHVLYSIAVSGFMVAVFDRRGAVVDRWGVSGVGTGQIFNPTAFHIDAAGNAFVGMADQVRKFNSAHVYQSVFGTNGTGNGQFIAISDISTHTNGKIYVSDSSLNRVQRFTSAGVYEAQQGTTGTGFAEYMNISSIAVDSTNDFLYVVDRTMNRVTRLVASTMAYLGWVNPVGFTAPPGLLSADVRNGTLYVASPTTVVQGDNLGFWQKFDIPADNRGAWINVGSSYIYIVDNFAGIVGKESQMWQLFGRTTKLSDAFLYIINQVLTYNSYTFSYTASSDPEVQLIGWSGDVWDHLRQLCAAHGVELYQSGTTIGIRDVGTRSLPLTRVEPGSVSLTLNSQATGRSVDFINYATSPTSSVLPGIIYDSRVGDEQAYSVGVGETKVVTVNVSAFPSGVLSPSAFDWQEPYPQPFPSSGGYAVIGADSLPVVAQQWKDYGGSITAIVSPTIPNALELTLKGPTRAIPGVPGPYTFGLSDGSNTYPLLVITGWGLLSTPVTVNILAGADPKKTTQDVAFQVDNFAHSSIAMIYKRVTWPLARASGPSVGLTARIPTSAITGFGVTSGSIVDYKESKYRITNASIGNEWVDITAVRHITVGNFDSFMGTTTVGQFDTFWTGNNAEDLKIKPLRKVV